MCGGARRESRLCDVVAQHAIRYITFLNEVVTQNPKIVCLINTSGQNCLVRQCDLYTLNRQNSLGDVTLAPDTHYCSRPSGEPPPCQEMERAACKVQTCWYNHSEESCSCCTRHDSLPLQCFPYHSPTAAKCQ